MKITVTAERGDFLPAAEVDALVEALRDVAESHVGHLCERIAVTEGGDRG